MVPGYVLGKIHEQRQRLVGYVVCAVGRNIADRDADFGGTCQVNAVISGPQAHDAPASFKTLDDCLVEQGTHRLNHHHIGTSR
jgi:hypothetical protein